MLKLVASYPALILGWLIMRAGLVALSVYNYEPRGDIYYYFAGLYGDNPKDMTEYPHAGVWPTELLGWITGPDVHAFVLWFCAMCLVLDFAFLITLRVFGRHNLGGVAAAGWFWVFFGTLAGQVFMMRLDLFPALAVAAAAACVVRFPIISSVMLAWATTMKLWPGVLAAGLVGRFNRGATWVRVVSFFAAGVALCAYTVITQGWDRLLSPLTYQGDRGLQVESIAATPFVLKGYASPEEWTVGYAASKSFEIDGPGVSSFITVSTVAMGALVLFAAGWAALRLFRGNWSPRSTQAFFVVIVLGLMVTNKVFSPQYIVWLGPLLAVVMCTPRATPASTVGAQHAYRSSHAEQVVLGILAVACLIAAGLGTYVYPFHYDAITFELGSEYAPVLALAVRNGLIVAMFLLAIVWFVIINRNESRQRALPDE